MGVMGHTSPCYCGNAIPGSQHNTWHLKNSLQVTVAFSMSTSWEKQNLGKLIYGLSVGVNSFRNPKAFSCGQRFINRMSIAAVCIVNKWQQTKWLKLKKPFSFLCIFAYCSLIFPNNAWINQDMATAEIQLSHENQASEKICWHENIQAVQKTDYELEW